MWIQNTDDQYMTLREQPLKGAGGGLEKNEDGRIIRVYFKDENWHNLRHAWIKNKVILEKIEYDTKNQMPPGTILGGDHLILGMVVFSSFWVFILIELPALFKIKWSCPYLIRQRENFQRSKLDLQYVFRTVTIETRKKAMTNNAMHGPHSYQIVAP